MAKAPDQDTSDGEWLRLGERIGLDTRVALAVNYADSGVALTACQRSTVGKLISLPPGEYGRKVET